MLSIEHRVAKLEGLLSVGAKADLEERAADEARLKMNDPLLTWDERSAASEIWWTYVLARYRFSDLVFASYRQEQERVAHETPKLMDNVHKFVSRQAQPVVRRTKNLATSRGKRKPKRRPS